jgi:hypothetical protein
MAVTASIDRIDLLSCQERFGVIIRLTRKAYIKGLTDTDHTALFAALEAAGLPASGTALGKDGLVLAERNPTIIEGSPDQAEVILVYEHYKNEGQSYDNPPVGPFVGTTRASLQQITTNKDQNGDLILLQHTYPADDPDFPNETKYQTGEISVFVPQKTLTVTGVKQTQAPWLIANNIIAKLNSTTFAQADARHWLCTLASWENMDPSTGANRYFMTFEFQHNPDSWDPTAVFNDENTNRPPANLVDGEGYKTIEYLDAVDFNSVIGTYIQGG